MTYVAAQRAAYGPGRTSLKSASRRAGLMAGECLMVAQVRPGDVRPLQQLDALALSPLPPLLDGSFQPLTHRLTCPGRNDPVLERLRPRRLCSITGGQSAQLFQKVRVGIAGSRPAHAVLSSPWVGGKPCAVTVTPRATGSPASLRASLVSGLLKQSAVAAPSHPTLLKP